MLGVLDDVEAAVPAGFRRPNNTIVLLGSRAPGREGLEETFSSSEYALRIRGVAAGLPPAVDLAYEKSVHDCCLELINRGYVDAAHDISDGGLLVALAECCFMAPESRGALVTLASDLPLEAYCFGEEPSRILLEVDEKHLADLLRVARKYRLEARQLGWTTTGEFRVHFNGNIVLDEGVSRLAEAWRGSLAQLLEGRTA
jgi:phosphoribosylformylglycinamidine synthase